MALSLERVKAGFALYSGEDPEMEDARGKLCAQLCQECLNGIEAKLKGRVVPEGSRDEGALESWAAAQAFYQLALADEAVSPQVVSADGVRVEAGERSEKARVLAAEKEKTARTVLGEGAFYFGRT